MEESTAREWMSLFVLSHYFAACEEHPYEKMNYFCVDCVMALCSSCLRAHYKHKHIQIRKYVYQSVVNVKDMRKFSCVKGIQTYSTNNAKVIHLKPKPVQSKIQQNAPRSCLRCNGGLQETFLYCCLACKVLHENGKIFELGSDSCHSSLPIEMTNNGYEETTDHENNGSDKNINNENKGRDGMFAPIPVNSNFRKRRRKQEKPTRALFKHENPTRALFFYG